MSNTPKLTPEERKKLEKKRDLLLFLKNPQMAFFSIMENKLEDLEKSFKEQAEKKISESVESALLKEFQLAEKQGKQAAEEKISEFQKATSAQIKKILLNIEETKNQVVEKTKKEISEIAEEFKKELAVIIEQSKEFVMEIQGQVGQMRGAPGKDADENKIIQEVLNKFPKNEVVEELKNSMQPLMIDEFKKSWEAKVQQALSQRGLGTGGGKQLRMTSFSFTGDGTTTAFTLPKEPGAKGKAIWAYYNGQQIQLGVHYTLAGKTMNTTFTPENNQIIEGYLINY